MSGCSELPYSPSTWRDVAPSAAAWLAAEVDPRFADLLSSLKRRDAREPRQWAELTLDVLDRCIGKSLPADLTVSALLRFLRRLGSVLTQARPAEITVGNMVRRTLAIVRREAKAHVIRARASSSGTGAASAAADGDSPSPAAPRLRLTPVVAASSAATNDAAHSSSLSGLFGFAGTVDDGSWAALPALPLVADISASLVELRDDLNDASIAAEAPKHVYANEVILTFGYSPTLVRFLRKAADDRAFEVFVAETAPSLSGHKLATELAQYGLRVTVIQDAAVFAVMPSVSKAVIDAHAVLADGGVLARAGAANVALAAHSYSVPVVALAGLYKLSPLFAFEQETFSEPLPPARAASFGDACEGFVDVVNPTHDYVSPQQVSLLISNLDETMSAYQPSYVYRLVAQLYDAQDYALEDDEDQCAEAKAATAV